MIRSAGIDLSLTVNEGVSIEVGGSDTLYVVGTFDKDELVDTVLSEFPNPEDLFEEKDLIEWAESSGFIQVD